MLRLIDITQGWLIAQLDLPYSVGEQPPIAETTLVFSEPKLVLALVTGVIMAFAFQLLFTNLAIAIVASPNSPSQSSDSESFGDAVKGIETKVGLALLISVSIALFAASFLAVKLSLVDSNILGAIIGVVIWSGFFSLLTWFGSTAMGSLLGSVISTATTGIQGLVGSVARALGINVAKSQVVSTAEEITAAVRRELTAGFDADSIKTTLQNSLSGIQLPQLDLVQIRSQFEKLLKDADLGSIADSDLLKNVDRDTLVQLVSSRTDLSKQDIDRITDQLEGAWKQVVSQPEDPNPQELLNQSQSAPPQDLQSGLNEKLGQVVKSASARVISEGNLTRALQFGSTALLSRVLKTTDFSDLDVEKIPGQLQTLKTALLPSSNQPHGKSNGHSNGSSNGKSVKVPKSFSVIQADLEDYLLFSPAWDLNRETVKKEFRDLIYNAAADPSILRQELEVIDRNYLSEVLSLRSDFTPEGVQDLVRYLDQIRAEVFSTVQASEQQDKSQDLRNRVEEYLRSTGKAELNPDAIEQDFKLLLEDPDLGLDALGDRLGQFDRNTLEQLLSRQDIGSNEVSQIVDQLEATRDRVLSQAKELQDQVEGEAQELRHKVEEYLRNASKEELNPESIQPDLKALFDDPQAGLSALRGRLSQFDRETLVKLLSQRGDLTEAQVNQTIDQIQASARSLIKAPRRLASRIQKQAGNFEANLERYLTNTNKAELNPEGIKRDLQLLLQDPRSGLSSLGDRASQFDRQTLVALLIQRDDITEAEANQIADQVESTYKSVREQIQQVQQKVQATINKGFGSVRNYLNGLKRPELNYDGLKQDFGKLFDDPQVGLVALRDRLGQIDRDSLVAVLSSREEISAADANHIVDQIEATRDSALHRIERVQQETQSRLEAIKHQTQKQVRKTRKVASRAAWWVFSSALFSLAASAIAGFLAVSTPLY